MKFHFQIPFLLLAIFTFFFLINSSSNAQDGFAKFYNQGEDPVCGLLPRSCRNPTCGLDTSFSELSAICIGRGEYAQSHCQQINPSIAITDKARERGQNISSVAREIKVTSPGGVCQWDSWEERTGSFMIEATGECCEAVDLSGDYCLGPDVPCYETVNYCDIKFRFFANCENSSHCGERPKTCRNIVFGIDEVSILELSPFIENEKLFRNAINSIFINFKADLLSNFEANARVNLAETAFNDVEKLKKIISEEIERRE